MYTMTQIGVLGQTVFELKMYSSLYFKEVILHFPTSFLNVKKNDIYNRQLLRK